MNEPDGILKGIQDEMAANLRRDSWFQGINILTEDIGDIANQIQINLQKIGLLVLILTPQAKCTSPDCPGPLMDPIIPVVGVHEFVLVNRGPKGTKRPCSAVAERVAWQLHYANHAHERQDEFHLSCTDLILQADKSLLIYKVLFETKSGLAGISPAPSE